MAPVSRLARLRRGLSKIPEGKIDGALKASFATAIKTTGRHVENAFLQFESIPRLHESLRQIALLQKEIVTKEQLRQVHNMAVRRALLAAGVDTHSKRKEVRKLSNEFMQRSMQLIEYGNTQPDDQMRDTGVKLYKALGTVKLAAFIQAYKRHFADGMRRSITRKDEIFKGG